MHLGILAAGIENGRHWSWPSRSFVHFDSQNSIQRRSLHWSRLTKECYTSQTCSCSIYQNAWQMSDHLTYQSMLIQVFISYQISSMRERYAAAVTHAVPRGFIWDVSNSKTSLQTTGSALMHAEMTAATYSVCAIKASPGFKWFSAPNGTSTNTRSGIIPSASTWQYSQVIAVEIVF